MLLLLGLPLGIWAMISERYAYIIDFLPAGETEGSELLLLAGALDAPSDQSPHVIEKLIYSGADVIRMLFFYLDHQGHKLTEIQRVISLLPLTGGKCLIPCVSHFGSLWSIASMVTNEELMPVLQLVASVSATPPLSVDVWNICTSKMFWNFGIKDSHSDELVQALGFLMENGCPLNIPLLYQRFQKFPHTLLEGASIVPTAEKGWFNPVMHLLWDDEALGKHYLAVSLGRNRANPNEEIFSHVCFLGEDKETSRSILGHVLAVFADDIYFGKKCAQSIATILIAFGASTDEFFQDATDGTVIDCPDEEKQSIIVEAQMNIREITVKLWLLSLISPTLLRDTRTDIGKMVCNFIM